MAIWPSLSFIIDRRISEGIQLLKRNKNNPGWLDPRLSMDEIELAASPRSINYLLRKLVKAIAEIISDIQEFNY